MSNRIITHEGYTFDDPGAEFTEQDILQGLVLTFPELKGGKVESKEIDGVIHLTFKAPPKRLGADIETMPSASGDIADWVSQIVAALEWAKPAPTPPPQFDVPDGLISIRVLWKLRGRREKFRTINGGTEHEINRITRKLEEAPAQPYGVALL